MNNKKLLRESFRNSVFNRDLHECVICGETESLDAHHITDRNEMPNGGYVLENGITLCEEHHKLAEIYHSSNCETYAAGYHPDDLYKLINSSLSIAYQKSLELK